MGSPVPPPPIPCSFMPIASPVAIPACDPVAALAAAGGQCPRGTATRPTCVCRQPVRQCVSCFVWSLSAGNMGTWEHGNGGGRRLQGDGRDQGSGTQARRTPERPVWRGWHLFGPKPLSSLFVCIRVAPNSSRGLLNSFRVLGCKPFPFVACPHVCAIGRCVSPCPGVFLVRILVLVGASKGRTGPFFRLPGRGEHLGGLTTKWGGWGRPAGHMAAVPQAVPG
jgi:hypothetical protein